MTRNGKQIRVMIVDDHPIVRIGLRAVIDTEPDFTLVAEATTGREAVELFRQHQPDVTLVDLRLPDICGVEVIETVRKDFPASRFLVLTSYDTDEDIHRAIEAGASGYLLKGMFDDEFVEAVRAVFSGFRYIPPAIARRLDQRPPPLDLTAREREILKLLVQGLSNKEIAARLSITKGTVRWFLTNIFGKLGVRDRTQAVTVALKRGIVQL